MSFIPLRRGGERLREHHVRRLVAEVARQVHCGGHLLTEGDQRLGVGLELGACADDHAGEGRLGLAVPGEILGEAIGAELEPFGHGTEVSLEASRERERE